MVKMKAVYKGGLATECIHESGAAIQTIAPKDIGGEGNLFSPTDLFAASLGTCMLTLMGVQAKKLGFDLTGSTAEIEKIMTSAPPRKVEKLIIQIRCPRTPNSQAIEKLEAAALECPIHRSIHPSIQVETGFVWGI